MTSTLTKIYEFRQSDVASKGSLPPMGHVGSTLAGTAAVFLPRFSAAFPF